MRNEDDDGQKIREKTYFGTKKLCRYGKRIKTHYIITAYVITPVLYFKFVTPFSIFCSPYCLSFSPALSFYIPTYLSIFFSRYICHFFSLTFFLPKLLCAFSDLSGFDFSCYLVVSLLSVLIDLLASCLIYSYRDSVVSVSVSCFFPHYSILFLRHYS